MTRILIFLFVALILLACAGREAALSQDQVPRISKEDLKAKLGNPDVTIIDVRQDADWAESEMKIRGAVREEPKDFAQWSGKYPKNGVLVLYCA